MWIALQQFRTYSAVSSNAAIAHTHLTHPRLTARVNIDELYFYFFLFVETVNNLNNIIRTDSIHIHSNTYWSEVNRHNLATATST